MPDLADKLDPLILELLEIAWNEAATETGAVLGAFNVNNPYVVEARDQIGKRLRGVDETIDGIIKDVIVDATQRGLSRSETVKELLERGATDSPMRAEMIAVTETANAHSAGSILAYRASGVVSGVEWLTADAACEVCGPLNGKVVPLGDEFAPGITQPSAHPRCRCAIAPVLS